MKFKQWCSTCNTQVEIDMDENNIVLAECPKCGRALKPCGICNAKLSRDGISCVRGCPFRKEYLEKTRDFG